jgi:hypothetical protein
MGNSSSATDASKTTTTTPPTAAPKIIGGRFRIEDKVMRERTLQVQLKTSKVTIGGITKCAHAV